MPSIRLSLLCALLAIIPAAVQSQPSSSLSARINEFRLGGYVIVLRHGATVSDQGRGDSMSGKNVSTERQLNEEGRAQAKSIGESIRHQKIPVSLVLTSPIQRAVDTAMLLGLGKVTLTSDLAESASPDERNRHAQAFRKLIAKRPPPDSNVLVVSHKPNIVDAFGKDFSDISEGEASVFEPDGHGGYKLIVRIRADEWEDLQ